MRLRVYAPTLPLCGQTVDVKSYLMGLFDGEGCISAACTGGNWTAIIKIGMSVAAPVQLFYETWGLLGGYFNKRVIATKNGLTMYYCEIKAMPAVPFLTYAAEHSLVKREQARLALEMIALQGKYNLPGARKGINVKRGERFFTEEERLYREERAIQIRNLNGGRTRYATLNVPADPSADAFKHARRSRTR